MTGKKIPKAKRLKIRSAPPDDPIYSRGFVIGAIGLRPSPESMLGEPTPSSAKSAPNVQKNPYFQEGLRALDKILEEEVPQQFEQTDESN